MENKMINRSCHNPLIIERAQRSFTLLELVIVVVIVGVLASLALPRFFRLIERARAVEGLQALRVIHQAIERCYLMRGARDLNDYLYCQPDLGWDRLDIDNPFVSPGAHFRYVSGQIWSSQGGGYAIRVDRNSYEIAVPSSQYNIVGCSPLGGWTGVNGYGSFVLCSDSDGVEIAGAGIYEGMHWGN